MSGNKILNIQTLLLFLCGLFFLALFSQPVFAAVESVAWKTYLFSVMAIALVIAVFVSWRNPKTESFMGRFLLAGLYFWILTFAQLIVLALIYYFTK